MRVVSLFILLCSVQGVSAQKYFSKTGKISFYSDAAMEKIEAHNTSASTVLDASSGSIEWAVLVQGFAFEKALMQDHFNENYMESAKYPKAKFKGRIDNMADVHLSKDGTYPVTVSGTMELHGVSRPITAQGTITVKNKAVTAQSRFSILVADYNIEIPKIVADKIAKKVDITVSTEYQMMPATP